MNNYISCKFDFTFTKKFVTMDLSLLATIDDIKMVFGNILQINLFSKKLIYYNNDNQVINSSKMIKELIEDKEIKVNMQVNNHPIVFHVQQEEEGA